MKTKILIFLIAIVLAGCGRSGILDPKNPVTLSMWHPYDEQMRTGMDELIEEFNRTVGQREGIIIETTFVAVATPLNEMLFTAASGDPGAPELPDIAVINHRAAISFAERGLLLNFEEQFSAEELNRFVPAFIEQGRLGRDGLYLLPIAKSTEVLYVNTTIFDRFSRDTGVTISQLATFEGIAEVSRVYHNWTYNRYGVGKTFYYPSDPFHFSLIGFQQLGENFIRNEQLNFSSPVFQRIWDMYYPNAVRGYFAIFDSFSTYLMLPGEIVCTTDTTAAMTYLPSSAIYADNTREDIVYAILPYPVFEGGNRVAMQRGGGIGVFRSDSRKEYAASIFLKWLTDPPQNLRFTTRFGYLPVTEAAYGDFLTREMERMGAGNFRNLYETVAEMQREYSFHFPPVFDGLEAFQRRYRADLLRAAADSRQVYLTLRNTHDSPTAFMMATDGAFEGFIRSGR